MQKEIEVKNLKNNIITKIIKEENDPLCLRASIGGTKENGFYIVYRGNENEILEMLQEIKNGFEIFNKMF